MSFLSAMSEKDGTTEVDFSQILCAFLTSSSPHREGKAILENKSRRHLHLGLHVLRSSLVVLVLGESVLEELID